MEYVVYALVYLVAIIGGKLLPIVVAPQAVLDSNAVTAVTITALFASLLVPFAAFASKEGWNRQVLKYGPVVLLGFLLGVSLKSDGTALHSVQLVLATLIHAAYWLSSVQSRAYRLEQFRIGFSSLIHTAQLIAMLNGQQCSHESDKVITALLAGKRPDLEKLEANTPDLKNLLERVKAELNVPTWRMDAAD